MFNAQKAYFAKTTDGIVFISYNEFSPIAIALDGNFNRNEIINELSQFIKLKSKGESTQLGQKTEVKEMFDGGKSIGFLFISYGINDALNGTGSIAYMMELPK